METPSTCPYCGVLIKTENAKITGVRGDPNHPANFGRLCTKGATLHLSATRANRVLYPEFRLAKDQPRRQPHGRRQSATRRTISRQSSRTTARTRWPSTSPASPSPRTTTSSTKQRFHHACTSKPTRSGRPAKAAAPTRRAPGTAVETTLINYCHFLDKVRSRSHSQGKLLPFTSEEKSRKVMRKSIT